MEVSRYKTDFVVVRIDSGISRGDRSHGAGFRKFEVQWCIFRDQWIPGRRGRHEFDLERERERERKRDRERENARARESGGRHEFDLGRVEQRTLPVNQRTFRVVTNTVLTTVGRWASLREGPTVVTNLTAYSSHQLHVPLRENRAALKTSGA